MYTAHCLVGIVITDGAEGKYLGRDHIRKRCEKQELSRGQKEPLYNL